MRVEVVTGALARDERKALYGWGSDIFGTGSSRRLAQFPCRPFACLVVGYENDRPVTALGLLRATVAIDDRLTQVAGFGALVVVPSEQGKGYGAQLLVEAKRVADEQWGGNLSLLAFCENHRLSYYQRRGFTKIAGPVRITNRAGESVPTPQHTVWSEETPASSADMRGPRW